MHIYNDVTQVYKVDAALAFKVSELVYFSTIMALTDAAQFARLKETFNPSDKCFHSILRVWKHCEGYSYDQHRAALCDSLVTAGTPFISALLAFFLKWLSNAFTAATEGKPSNTRYIPVMTSG